MIGKVQELAGRERCKDVMNSCTDFREVTGGGFKGLGIHRKWPHRIPNNETSNLSDCSASGKSCRHRTTQQRVNTFSYTQMRMHTHMLAENCVSRAQIRRCLEWNELVFLIM